MIRIWARWPTGLTPKVADIVPGSPIALGDEDKGQWEAVQTERFGLEESV